MSANEALHVVLEEAMVQFAKALGQETVAAGIEDAEALALIRACEVDYAQGFHIGERPRSTAPSSASRPEVEYRQLDSSHVQALLARVHALSKQMSAIKGAAKAR